MEVDSEKTGDTGQHDTRSQDPNKSTGFDKIKNIIADKLHVAAETLGQKAEKQDAQSAAGLYGREASEWLDQSAEYVRQFDYEKTDAEVRGYVRHKPARSLIIAGGVGLMLGVFLRRR